MSALGWCRKQDGGLVVTVRLTPKSGRDAVEGIATIADGREVLKARVRALPADGAANAALVNLISKSLRVPKSAIAVVSGPTQRLKQVRIAGDPADLSERLARLAGK